jgi:hypothetical protein
MIKTYPKIREAEKMIKTIETLITRNILFYNKKFETLKSEE